MARARSGRSLDLPKRDAVRGSDRQLREAIAKAQEFVDDGCVVTSTIREEIERVMSDGRWRSAEMIARACAGGRPGAVRAEIAVMLNEERMGKGKAPVAGKGRMVPVYRLKGKA
jgi:hypothetical protein